MLDCLTFTVILKYEHLLGVTWWLTSWNTLMTLFKCLIFCCPYRTLGFFLCFIILLLLCKLFNLLLLCMLLICLILRAFEPFIFAWLFLLLWVLIVLLVPIFFLRLFQHAGKFCLKVDLAHPTLDTCTFSFCGGLFLFFASIVFVWTPSIMLWIYSLRSCC